MNARIGRAAGIAVVGVSVLLLAACEDTGPPSPLPATRDPNQPVTLSPTVYLLRPDQMAGYNRSGEKTLSADAIASDDGDPSLAPHIQSQGLTYGTLYTYAPPSASPDSTPFREVISEAFIFTSSTGAESFLSDEKVRQNQPPSKGGTIVPLTGAATTNTDELTGFYATAPESDQTTPPQSYLVLARHGRVVVELLAAGTVENATRAQFDTLLGLQETLLAQSPDT